MAGKGQEWAGRKWAKSQEAERRDSHSEDTAKESHDTARNAKQHTIGHKQALGLEVKRDHAESERADLNGGA